MSKEKLKAFFKRKDTIIGLIIAVITIGCLVWLYVKDNKEASKPIATVYVDGQAIIEVDLNKVTERQVIDLDEALGIPVKFELVDHQMRFFEVDCPDKICEGTGFLRSNLDIASCIPNRTMVIVEDASEK